MKNGNKGFTLVELSIVIVIVGLIIAGVTAGQTLIRGAQLRSVITQADQVRAAVNAFKLQYNGLPGDLTNGTTFFTTGCLGADATSTSVADDCNGDGNKQISIASKSTATFAKESYIAWQQLSLAKLFPGSYIPGNIDETVGTIGTNIPASKFNGAGITIGYNAATMLTSSNTAGTSKNIILFGFPGSTLIANTPFLTPSKASSIDQKADDGVATTGSVYAGFSAGAGVAGALTTCANTSTGVYVFLTATATCSIGFVL